MGHRSEQRIAVRVPILVQGTDSRGVGFQLPAETHDISGSGACYVEMLSPLPEGSLIEIAMNPGETVIHALGQVVTTQMGLGMGIVFTAVTPEDYEKFRKLAPPAEKEHRHVVVSLRAPSHAIADAKRSAP